MQPLAYEWVVSQARLFNMHVLHNLTWRSGLWDYSLIGMGLKVWLARLMVYHCNGEHQQRIITSICNYVLMIIILYMYTLYSVCNTQSWCCCWCQCMPIVISLDPQPLTTVHINNNCSRFTTLDRKPTWRTIIYIKLWYQSMLESTNNRFYYIMAGESQYCTERFLSAHAQQIIPTSYVVLYMLVRVSTRLY